MSGLKWVMVVILSLVFWVTASAVGIGFSIDRSFGNTEFISGLIFRQDLSALAGAASEKGKSSNTFSGATIALLEPEIKKQTKPMLDTFYTHLKGKSNEPRLAIGLQQYKQDPALPKAAAKLLKGNEATKYLPEAFAEPAARMLIEKLPDELDLIKILSIRESDLTYARNLVGSFYRYYALAMWSSLIVAVLICALLRNRRQILVSLGIVLLTVSVTLFIPYLMSESMIGKMFLSGNNPAPEIVKKFAANVFREFFAVYLMTPVVIGLTAIGGIAAGAFAFRQKNG